MSGTRLAGLWLLGGGAWLTVIAVGHRQFGGLGFPFLLGAVGVILLMRSREVVQAFPGTELERGLDRLFTLLLPARTATTMATARVFVAQEMRRSVLRRSARRWAKELQRIATDGYETASRISAHSGTGSMEDDQVLVAEAVRVLGIERQHAGVDLAVANDQVSMLAYGLGARPAAADLTSLEALLQDLGLSDEGDELRTHFDEIISANSRSDARLRNDAERSLFRELAGASFVLGAAARIVELASRPASETTSRIAAAF